MTWTTPAGHVYTLYQDMLEQTHLLIGGGSRMGKTTLLKNLMHTAMFKSPRDVQFVIIDPRIVEVQEYENVPHTICYKRAFENGTIDYQPLIDGLQFVVNVIERRYEKAERNGLTEWAEDGELYVVIDELQDLLMSSTHKKFAIPLLQEIVGWGRGSHTHMIATTRSAARSVIPANIDCNFGQCVAFRCFDARESRQIVGISGAETIEPRTQLMYRKSANDITIWSVPFVSDEERAERIKWWVDQVQKSPERNVIRLFKKK